MDENKKKPEEMSEAARQARNEYIRAWRRRNPDKVMETHKRYWERKAAQAAAQAEG